MNEQIILDTVIYGSRLYGTNTDKSDYDYKVIYIPSMKNMLLGKKFKKIRERFSTTGEAISTKISMQDNGSEYEHIPLSVLINDFTQGQTYALEVMYALSLNPEYTLCAVAKEVIAKFPSGNFISMVSFAKKQTLDYISRARRLNDVNSIIAILESAMNSIPKNYKLDVVYDSIPDNFHIIMENDVKPYRGIYVAGRKYSERTSISDIHASLEIIRDDYGTRVHEAITNNNVDWKSISAAIRCYEQAIELHDTGVISFPRKNKDYLLAIRQGEIPFDEVRPYLEQLSDTLDAIVIQKSSYTEEQVDTYIAEVIAKYVYLSLR
jgi:hypothetical protein